ncbi:transmembrane protein, putative [Medicago truncatula]|uniref:Transmembrane protein, putative n=2 Tax=Medicago truncatula TaxID=3880 RepID=A0A072U9S2_MEDTR|nr:transmembrane protein, putative [Medicago truncatula]
MGMDEIAPLHLRPKQNDQNALRSIFFINPPLLFSKKHKTCNEWIWDDELYPATRPMTHCYSAEAESASLNAPVIREHESAPLNGAVIREAESAKSGRSANQPCNCGEIWEKKKEKWKMKVLAEKKKVEWLKWIIIATWLIFAVFFVKK